MRSNVYWRRAVFVVVIAGGCFAFLTPELGVIGIGVAEAKPFYTRKRVNGVWVKGRFAKRGALQKGHAGTPKTARRSRSASLPATTGSLSAAPGPATAPAAAPSQALIQANSSAHMAWLTPGASAAQPSGPAPGAAIAQTMSPPGAFAPQTVLSGPGVSGPRTPSPALPQMAPAGLEPPLVSPSDELRLSKLREALQARATTLASGAGVAAAPMLRPAPEPQSVTFDFKSGVKTTIFADGSIVEDAFDVSALRGMASTPPAASGLGR